MRRTRAQLLWTFQIYLDSLNIYDPDRRDSLTRLYLSKNLSRSTDRAFSHWLKTNRHLERPAVMRTRGSRLAAFCTFLDRHRPDLDKDGRDRLIRFYANKQLSRVIEETFHRFVREDLQDGRTLPGQILPSTAETAADEMQEKTRVFPAASGNDWQAVESNLQGGGNVA